MEDLEIAIVGCGAVAAAHLAVVPDVPGLRVTALVDKALDRARDLAAKHHISMTFADYREIEGKVQGAIIALPHHLHAPVSSDLLRRGLHLMVEKPMAMSAAECDQMLEAAREGNARMSVGLARRYYGGSIFVKHALDKGLLGDIVRFDGQEGMVYSWPVASDFMFKKEAGGGVLADTGAHALDLMLWWLGDVAEVRYRDDARGGVEADCELTLRMASGAEGQVRLSRTRDLRNTWILEGTEGTLEIETKFDPEISISLKGRPGAFEGRWAYDGEGEPPLECFIRQLKDFTDAVREGRDPLVSGTEARRSVALIERCYAAREELVQPWEASGV